MRTRATGRVAGGKSTPTPLEAYGPRRGPLDERWNILVNGPIEPAVIPTSTASWVAWMTLDVHAPARARAP